jgi:hypothetical protein
MTRDPALESFALIVSSSDGVRVQALLVGHPAVRSAAKGPEGIRVGLRPDYASSVEEAAADITRYLLQAGLAVDRVDPRVPTPRRPDRP